MNTPGQRYQYEMTRAQFDTLIEACKPVPMIMLQCGEPSSPQENANRAWCRLGDELGFDGMTVEPAKGTNARIFTAIAKEMQSTKEATSVRYPCESELDTDWFVPQHGEEINLDRIRVLYDEDQRKVVFSHVEGRRIYIGFDREIRRCVAAHSGLVEEVQQEANVLQLQLEGYNRCAAEGIEMTEAQERLHLDREQRMERLERLLAKARGEK